MENTQLQVLLHGENIADCSPEIRYDGVKLSDIIRTENNNYLFLYLEISKNAKPGTVDIQLTGDTDSFTHTYLLKQRDKSYTRPGLDASDAIYLIAPDRFANGDTTNDSVNELLEKADRNNAHGRHGGDIQGIINKLDYIKDMGFTAIWSMPVLENDMKRLSYHGYSTTDHYNVDTRHGGNEKYLELAEKAHQKDLKIVMDIIFNQIGKNHYWMNDLPTQDWIHQWDAYTNSSFNSSVLPDPHASRYDHDVMLKGWFHGSMPDLNQSNSILATYLIQHTIFWVEYANLDGIRLDTYQYNYKDFLNDWLNAIYKEYPNLYIVGEVWYYEPEVISYWKKGFDYADGYSSQLRTITDFPVHYGIEQVFGHDKKPISLMYEIISRDFVYDDPTTNLIFVDNHDVTRLYTLTGEDINKFKQALAIILTTRGIPQILYGTEIVMTGRRHEILRADYPGGWYEDKRDAFTREGRTPLENDAYDYMTKILNWRKNMDAIHSGKLIHFQPYDGMYVYFRILDDKGVLVAINTNDKHVQLDSERHDEILQHFTGGVEIVSGEEIRDFKSLSVEANSVKIIELNK